MTDDHVVPVQPFGAIQTPGYRRIGTSTKSLRSGPKMREIHESTRIVDSLNQGILTASILPTNSTRCARNWRPGPQIRRRSRPPCRSCWTLKID